MPTIVQPQLRQLQRAMESNGLIQSRNGVERNQVVVKETAGRPEVYTKGFWILRGTKYTEFITGA